MPRSKTVRVSGRKSRDKDSLVPVGVSVSSERVVWVRESSGNSINLPRILQSHRPNDDKHRIEEVHPWRSLQAMSRLEKSEIFDCRRSVTQPKIHRQNPTSVQHPTATSMTRFLTARRRLIANRCHVLELPQGSIAATNDELRSVVSRRQSDENQAENKNFRSHRGEVSSQTELKLI
jgi:hypothetical protein